MCKSIGGALSHHTIVAYPVHYTGNQTLPRSNVIPHCTQAGIVTFYFVVHVVPWQPYHTPVEVESTLPPLNFYGFQANFSEKDVLTNPMMRDDC